jgi:hypothetical protein
MAKHFSRQWLLIFKKLFKLKKCQLHDIATLQFTAFLDFVPRTGLRLLSRGDTLTCGYERGTSVLPFQEDEYAQLLADNE